MTAIKRCCALALAVLMILTALPVTAFAQAAEQLPTESPILYN